MLNKILLMIICFFVISIAGGRFPDKKKTPGNVDPCITLMWVCNKFTDSTLPSFKNVIQAYKNYSIDIQDKRYSLDHLVPLNLGGTNDVSNLWPMNNIDFLVKKKIEENIFYCVCNGFIGLKEAQYILCNDWASWQIGCVK